MASGPAIAGGGVEGRGGVGGSVGLERKPLFSVNYEPKPSDTEDKGDRR